MEKAPTNLGTGLAQAPLSSNARILREEEEEVGYSVIMKMVRVVMIWGFMINLFFGVSAPAL